jgi:hypothetical protein
MDSIPGDVRVTADAPLSPEAAIQALEAVYLRLREPCTLDDAREARLVVARELNALKIAKVRALSPGAAAGEPTDAELDVLARDWLNRSVNMEGAYTAAEIDYPTLRAGQNALVAEIVERLRAALRSAAPVAAPEHDDCATMEDVTREVFCRVWEDGADAAMEEWRAWYKPSDWLWWGRGVGAFIYQRNKRLAGRAAVAAPGAGEAEPTRQEGAHNG